MLVGRWGGGKKNRNKARNRGREIARPSRSFFCIIFVDGLRYMTFCEAMAPSNRAHSSLVGGS